jgi:hypothetical protein
MPLLLQQVQLRCVCLQCLAATCFAALCCIVQGHCRVVDLPELQQLLALLEVYGPVLEPEGVDELLVQVRKLFKV